MDNLIGKRLDGRYSIESLVGVGGMANVYRGTDLKTGNRIAVKVLKEEFLDNEELVRRFDRAPKPMYYQPEFLDRAWTDYRVEKGLREDQVNPDDFIRWTYARALAHRQPRYAAMARRGVTLLAEEVADIRTPADLVALIGAAIDRKDA